MVTLLKFIQNIMYGLITLLTRISLKLMGVRFGKNLTAFFVTTIESPSNIVIGNNVWMSKNVAFYASNGVIIGNDVIIAKDVSFISSNHAFNRLDVRINEQGYSVKSDPIVIEDDVWVGEKAIILKSVRVGTGAVIGAGAVVTKEVPAHSVVAGNPAKIIAHRK